MLPSGELEQIKNEIHSIITSYGLAKVGYAPMEGIPVLGSVSRLGRGMNHAISLLWEIPMQAAYERSKVDRYYECMVHARSLQDEVATSIADLIKDHGHHALPVTIAFPMDRELITGQISHKAVAYQAGLGWIGKSSLLITPEFGPRVRLCTVLTDVRLDQGAKPLNNHCGECTRCIDVCPIKAIKNNDPDHDPSDRAEVFDRMICHRREEQWLKRSPPKFCAQCVSTVHGENRMSAVLPAESTIFRNRHQNGNIPAAPVVP
ncbi:MAG TPA: hypothetical protein VGK23_00550 [Methanomassiliicoccales archaeon]|jgi:epoxyqueuosine reductase QueG